MMVKSAEKQGDLDALLTASREYNEILEETIEKRTREKYKELQIVYDINQLKAEHARESGVMQRNVMLIALTAAVVLLVLLAVVFVLFRHSRRLAKKPCPFQCRTGCRKCQFASGAGRPCESPQ